LLEIGNAQKGVYQRRKKVSRAVKEEIDFSLDRFLTNHKLRGRTQAILTISDEGKPAPFTSNKAYTSEIASAGQADTQEPQSAHRDGSIQRTSFFSEIAPAGHSPSQAPQFTQESLI
jgi:hypothetical protein